MSVGKLETIWIKRAKLGPMDSVACADMIENTGIRGSSDQGKKRQVTIISMEKWNELMERLGASANPAGRRANLMLSGVDLTETRGKVLIVGDCRIKIWGETKPCERMDELVPGLREAMYENWGGGAFGIVLNSCRIAVGDSARWDETATNL